MTGSCDIAQTAETSNLKTSN